MSIIQDGRKTRAFSFPHLLNSLPCHLSPPLGLLGDLRKLPVTILVRKHVVGGLRRLKTMEGPLSCGPLSLSLFFSIVFLCSKGSLLQEDSILANKKNSGQRNRLRLGDFFMKSIPCSPRDYPKPSHSKCSGLRI